MKIRKLVCGTTLLALLALASIAATAHTISVLAVQIQGWQYENHSMYVLNTAPFYRIRYHYHEGALDGYAYDTGVWPPGADYRFYDWWQPAYDRVKVKGYNDYQEETIWIYYTVAFYD